MLLCIISRPLVYPFAKGNKHHCGKGHKTQSSDLDKKKDYGLSKPTSRYRIQHNKTCNTNRRGGCKQGVKKIGPASMYSSPGQAEQAKPQKNRRRKAKHQHLGRVSPVLCFFFPSRPKLKPRPILPPLVNAASFLQIQQKVNLGSLFVGLFRRLVFATFTVC